MRIAVSTMDGKTVCGHLGKCRSFIIFETDATGITGRSFISSDGLCPSHGGDHKVNLLDGCGAVITQGMGQGLFNGLMQAGIHPVITDQTDPDAAVKLFLDGGLAKADKPSCACGGEHHHH